MKPGDYGIGKREMRPMAWDKKTKQMCIVLETDFGSWVLLDTLEGKRLVQRDYDKVVIVWPTGLKDKNRKEIYEGDVVMYWGLRGEEDRDNPDGYTTDVVRFTYIGSSGHYDDAGWGYEDLWTEGVIIGNIFQNPELIEDLTP